MIDKKTNKMEQMEEQREVAEFEIGELLSVGMVLVVLGIGLSYGMQIMGDVRADMTVNSAEYNATSYAITGVGKIPEKMPTIATIVVASVIIGILVTYMWARFAK